MCKSDKGFAHYPHTQKYRGTDNCPWLDIQDSSYVYECLDSCNASEPDKSARTVSIPPMFQMTKVTGWQKKKSF